MRMWRKGNMGTASGNLNWCSHLESNKEFPQNIELLCDPATPFLSVYLKEIKTLTQKDTCTPMFITALFTIAKYPSVVEWIKKIWCVYYMCVCVYIYYSTITKKKILPLAIWMAS